MARRAKYTVYLPDRHVAKFSSRNRAIIYARQASEESGGWIEVTAPDGLIAQFNGGIVTPEFKNHVEGL